MPDFYGKRIILHPATVFLFCVVVVTVASLALWKEHSSLFLAKSEFQLSRDSIELVGAKPEWNQSLVNEISTTLLTQHSTLLDTNLVPGVVKLVKEKPQVKDVAVRKGSDRLFINVNYRVAIATVVIGGQLVPVDSDGMIVDDSATIELLRINMDRPSQSGLARWRLWPDQRVVAAAKVCEQLKDVWQELGLFQVVTYWKPGSSPHQQMTFELWTKYGGKVVWSSVVEDANQVPAEAKIHLLRAFIAEKGPIEKFAGKNKIDVREGHIKLVPDLKDTAAFQNSNLTRTAEGQAEVLLSSELNR